MAADPVCATVHNGVIGLGFFALVFFFFSRGSFPRYIAEAMAASKTQDPEVD